MGLRDVNANSRRFPRHFTRNYYIKVVAICQALFCEKWVNKSLKVVKCDCQKTNSAAIAANSINKKFKNKPKIEIYKAAAVLFARVKIYLAGAFGINKQE